MAQFAPQEAAGLYAAYRRQFLAAGWGVGGFREWPRAREAQQDVDSGPIIMGVGAAASGLGVGPARLFGDGEAYASILRLMSLTTMPRVLGDRSHLLLPILGEAILFHGETAVPWYQPLPPTATAAARAAAPARPGFPMLPLMVTVLLLAIVTAMLCRAWVLFRSVRGQEASH
jgi:hypothetical protein